VWSAFFRICSCCMRLSLFWCTQPVDHVRWYSSAPRQAFRNVAASTGARDLLVLVRWCKRAVSKNDNCLLQFTCWRRRGALLLCSFRFVSFLFVLGDRIRQLVAGKGGGRLQHGGFPSFPGDITRVLLLLYVLSDEIWRQLLLAVSTLGLRNRACLPRRCIGGSCST